MTLPDGFTYEIEDPYRYPSGPHRFRPAPLRRGNPPPVVREAGRAPDGPCTACAACASRCGRPTPSASAWSATSTNGTAAATPCARAARPACGKSSFPASQQGDLYKFEIKTRYMGYVAMKADPYGFASELRPKTASVVWDLNRYQWHDASGWPSAPGRGRVSTRPSPSTKCTWARGGASPTRMGIAGSPTASWPTSWCLTSRRWASRTSSCCRSRSIPFDGSWGYQTTGYFAPTIALRHAGRLPLLRRPGAPGAASA